MKIKVGLIQFRSTGSDNLPKALSFTRRALARGARIVCLPEVFRYDYFPVRKRAAVAHLLETVKGESVTAFRALAKRHRAVIIVPFYRKPGRFNSAVIIDPAGRCVEYKKTHIPHDRHYWEKNYFTSGPGEFPVVKTKYGNIAVAICYDQWYPEVARIYALKGADIVFYPTAIGTIKGDPQREGNWRDSWLTIQRAHSIANSIHIAAVNRVGREGDIRFFGSSFLTNPFGKFLVLGSESREQILMAQVDFKENRKIRAAWGFLGNRRPETYKRLLHGSR